MKKPYQEIEFELIELRITDSVMQNLSDLDDNELPFDPEIYQEP